MPDLGFVQLRVRATPSLPLAHEDFYLRPGLPIATAGFPLGERPLTVMEKLNQLTPSVRRGIISSVYPFSIRHPHGFTIDIMQQGGSSGSPIFREDEPLVVGMMAASIEEPLTIDYKGETLMLSQNTNISIAVPSATIRDALEAYREQYPQDLSGVPTLADHLASRMPTGEGIGWDILNPAS